jgi:hypothetical protein
LVCEGTLQNGSNRTSLLDRGESPLEPRDQSSTTGPTLQQRPVRSFGTNRISPRNGEMRSCRFDRLHEFVMAPIGSRFEGYVRVIDIYPSQQTLSTQGLNQICCQKAREQSGEDHYYCFGLHIQGEMDDSCEIDVIVSEGSGSAGSVVFGMAAAVALADQHGALFNLRSLLQDRALRKAAIHSFEYNGCKYFSLDTLS